MSDKGGPVEAGLESNKILTTAVVRDEMGTVFWEQRQAVLRYISKLKLVGRDPVTPLLNECLEALYRTCWGNDWPAFGDYLLDREWHNVMSDLTALISAFLRDKVLTETLPWQAGSSSEDRATFNPAVESLLDRDAEKLLFAHPDSLTTYLLYTLEQYVSALEFLYRLTYRKTKVVDTSEFQSDIAKVVERAVSFKAALDRGGRETEYTSPQYRQRSNPFGMVSDSDQGLSEDKNIRTLVAYTIMTGLFLSHEQYQMLRVHKARVVIMYEPKELGGQDK